MTKRGPASVEELRCRYEVERVHSEQVTRLALDLFDVTRVWLGLPAWGRRLLEAAAQLHDVAYGVDPVRHRWRGAMWVRRERLAGFTAAERGLIAEVMLCHSGNWRGVVRSREALRLGALLRIADGLDWGHVQDARIVGARREGGEIVVRVASDWFAGNVERAEQKADLWRAVMPVGIRFERVRGRGGAMVRAGLPALEAARRLLSVQYKTVLANVAGAMVGGDVEYLHRLRVAVRRCRQLLRLFGPVLPEARGLVVAWGRLGDALGPARDLDVWLALLRSAPVTEVVAGRGEWPAVVRYFERLRRREQAVVRRQLGGPALGRLRERMARLLRRELPGRACEVGLAELAARGWRKEVRRVRKRAGYRKSGDAERRHELRCALRRARYTGEFFGVVLGRQAGKWTRRLHEAERPLAKLHDLDVGEGLWGRAGGPVAPAVFGAWLKGRRKELEREAARAWRRLAGLPEEF